MKNALKNNFIISIHRQMAAGWSIQVVADDQIINSNWEFIRRMKQEIKKSYEARIEVKLKRKIYG